MHDLVFCRSRFTLSTFFVQPNRLNKIIDLTRLSIKKKIWISFTRSNKSKSTKGCAWVVLIDLLTRLGPHFYGCQRKQRVYEYIGRTQIISQCIIQGAENPNKYNKYSGTNFLSHIVNSLIACCIEDRLVILIFESVDLLNSVLRYSILLKVENAALLERRPFIESK